MTVECEPIMERRDEKCGRGSHVVIRVTCTCGQYRPLFQYRSEATSLAQYESLHRQRNEVGA